MLVQLTPGFTTDIVLFRRYRTNQLNEFERYRRDVIAHRADAENNLVQEGDPRGTYGDFPPPEV